MQQQSHTDRQDARNGAINVRQEIEAIRRLWRASTASTKRRLSRARGRQSRPCQRLKQSQGVKAEPSLPQWWAISLLQYPSKQDAVPLSKEGFPACVCCCRLWPHALEARSRQRSRQIENCHLLPAARVRKQGDSATAAQRSNNVVTPRQPISSECTCVRHAPRSKSV